MDKMTKALRAAGKPRKKKPVRRMPFPPEPRPAARRDIKALMATDAHRLVDDAIERGRGFLYVDGMGRVRDVRHDADVAALPPRPPRPDDADTYATPPVTPAVPTVLNELREIIARATRLVMQLGG